MFREPRQPTAKLHREFEMVLLERIELSTSALPRMRSTTELQQPTISGMPREFSAPSGRRALLAGDAYLVKRWRRRPCQALPRYGRSWTRWMKNR